MKYKFIIHNRLPSFNEYINKINRNKYLGNKFKRDVETTISWEIKTQLKNLKIDKPVILHITWIESNKRRDIDNIYSAVKYIQDALVKMQVLKNDNAKNVIDVRHKIKYAKESMVIVELEEIDGRN